MSRGVSLRGTGGGAASWVTSLTQYVYDDVPCSFSFSGNNDDDTAPPSSITFFYYYILVRINNNYSISLFSLSLSLPFSCLDSKTTTEQNSRQGGYELLNKFYNQAMIFILFPVFPSAQPPRSREGSGRSQIHIKIIGVKYIKIITELLLFFFF